MYPKIQVSSPWNPFKYIGIAGHREGHLDCPDGQFNDGTGRCVSCPPDFVYNQMLDICVHKEVCPTDFHWVGSHWQVDFDTEIGGGCILNNSECEKAFICPKCSDSELAIQSAKASFVGASAALIIVPILLGLGGYYYYKKRKKVM